MAAMVASPAALPADVVDYETFSQLLELDDEDSHAFSMELVYGYLSQARKTFEDMDQALKESKLKILSEKGHFLKGSSAALGLFKVSELCEKMQHVGALRQEDGSGKISEEEALERCARLLKVMKLEQKQAELCLRAFYDDAQFETGETTSDSEAAAPSASSSEAKPVATKTSKP